MSSLRAGGGSPRPAHPAAAPPQDRLRGAERGGSRCCLSPHAGPARGRGAWDPAGRQRGWAGSRAGGARPPQPGVGHPGAAPRLRNLPGTGGKGPGCCPGPAERRWVPLRTPAQALSPHLPRSSLGPRGAQLWGLGCGPQRSLSSREPLAGAGRGHGEAPRAAGEVFAPHSTQPSRAVPCEQQHRCLRALHGTDRCSTRNGGR